MYKVFIENKPIIFQINSDRLDKLNVEKTGKKIAKFLKSKEDEFEIKIKNESEFFEYFKKHKYIEAAGGLVQRGDTFLFIERNGVWDIPKGKLDPGETPKIAAVREIEEECGLLRPTIKEHLIDTWHTYEHKGKAVLKRTYWYWLEEGEVITPLIPQAEEGITAVAYFSEKEFEKIKANTFLSIIEVIDALLKNSKK